MTKMNMIQDKDKYDTRESVTMIHTVGAKKKVYVVYL